MAQAVSHRQSAQTVGTVSWHSQLAQAVGHSSRPQQSARAVGHIPARGRIVPFRRVVPFHRVARAAKQIVKARKPQSCALFSFRNQPFCSRLSGILLLCPCTLLRWPAILLPVVRHSASGVPPFCSRLPAILLPGFPQFYLRGPGLSSHSTFYLPKGSLSPSRFCFSVPNVQYYVTKAHYYHI